MFELVRYSFTEQENLVTEGKKINGKLMIDYDQYMYMLHTGKKVKKNKKQFTCF